MGQKPLCKRSRQRIVAFFTTEGQMAVTSIITIHDVYSVAARAPHSLGAPITIRIAGTRNDTEITLFFNDDKLVTRLVDAINKAAERGGRHDEGQAPKPPDADADAACAASHYAYGRYKR
jgi:hypothetical protein